MCRPHVPSLQHGHVFCLEGMWLRVTSHGVHLMFSPSRSQRPSSGQHRHGVSRHAGKLKSKRPVEKHDSDTEDPLEYGRCMLEDKALLTEEDSAWKTLLKTKRAELVPRLDWPWFWLKDKFKMNKLLWWVTLMTDHWSVVTVTENHTGFFLP